MSWQLVLALACRPTLQFSPESVAKAGVGIGQAHGFEQLGPGDASGGCHLRRHWDQLGHFAEVLGGSNEFPCLVSAEMNWRPKLGSGEGRASVRVWVLAPATATLEVDHPKPLTDRHVNRRSSRNSPFPVYRAAGQRRARKLGRRS